MSFTVLIPARLASTRLPNKPLADIGGAPMVVRVAQRAMKSTALRTVVATDSNDIVQSCAAFGVDAVLTRTDHPSGSDRLAEACMCWASGRRRDRGECAGRRAVD
jgi:3-deoxy-manno-octulosonate cytidylyltransferase (CMP-KDO synthetase)